MNNWEDIFLNTITINKAISNKKKPFGCEQDLLERLHVIYTVLNVL